MPNELLLFERREGIAIITFNNPRKRNILTPEIWDCFYQVLKKVARDEAIRAVIITGVGESFIAGGDISWLRRHTRQDAIEASRKGNEILLFLERLDKPVIAAINGWALGGGCELALACDIRIAAENAKFGQTEVRVGIIPGYGGTVRLPMLIGVGRAKEMILTGKIVDAREAERIGLVNKVVPREKLLDEAIGLAKKLAQGPASIKFAKQAINQALSLGFDEALKRNTELYGLVYETEDCFEGLQAFLEKREPVFKGR